MVLDDVYIMDMYIFGTFYYEATGRSLDATNEGSESKVQNIEFALYLDPPMLLYTNTASD